MKSVFFETPLFSHSTWTGIRWWQPVPLTRDAQVIVFQIRIANGALDFTDRHNEYAHGTIPIGPIKLGRNHTERYPDQLIQQHFVANSNLNPDASEILVWHLKLNRQFQGFAGSRFLDKHPFPGS